MTFLDAPSLKYSKSSFVLRADSPTITINGLVYSVSVFVPGSNNTGMSIPHGVFSLYFLMISSFIVEYIDSSSFVNGLSPNDSGLSN